MLSNFHRAFFAVLLVLASCTSSPERAALRKANALLDEGRVEEAWATVETCCIRQRPPTLELLQLRVYLLLKADRMDDARRMLQAMPPVDSTLTRALQHRDAGVRSGAAKLAAERPESVSHRVLLHGLNDQIPTVRRYCARALGDLRRKDALQPLFRSLRDDNWFVRAEVVTALAKIGEPRAAGWLVQMLNDRDGFVKYSAARALRDLAQPGNRELLLHALNRSSPEVGFHVAMALAKLQEPAAVPALLLAAKHGNAEIRQRAAEALGDYDAQPVTLGALAELAEDPEPVVREQALNSLSKAQGNTGSPQTATD